MRARYRAALASLAVLVVFAIGAAVGHFATSGSASKSAECIILSRDLDKLSYANDTRYADATAVAAARITGGNIVERYNNECRSGGWGSNPFD